MKLVQESARNTIRNGFLGAILGVIVLGNAYAKTDLFEIESLSVNHKVTKKPTKLNILGDMASEIMVIGLGENKEKTLDIIGYDSEQKGAVILKSLELDNSIYAWDISESENNGLQKIYLLGKDTIYVIDQSLELKSITNNLPNISSMFLADESDTFIHQDFIQDINQDEVDDFIVPYFTQVSVWLSDKGVYHQQVLPISSVMEASLREFVFKPRKLYFGEFSQQGTLDIAVVEHGVILYYALNSEGKFGVEPISIKVNSSIYGQEWWNLPGNDFDGADHTNVSHRSIIDISDINGDRIPDLVVDVAESESLLSKTNEIEFYFGELEEGKVVFPQQSQTIVSTGETMTPSLMDINGDNKTELLVTSFKLSLSKIISVLLSGSADIDIHVFGLKDGVYAAKPIVSKSLDVRINLSSGIQAFPMIEMLDVDGNGVNDLLVSDDDDEIKVHLASNEEGALSYARKGSKFEFDMPHNTDRIIGADIDGNGKGDLVVTYTKVDGTTKENQVTILYAQ